MKLRLTSEALLGNSVTLQLDQAGQSAGPLTVSDWGAAPGPDGGQIELIVSRSTLRCAPDSVRFEVDLSNATFDTPGPNPGEFFDARLHDLVFLWNTGDSGTWTKPQNVLADWRDKSTARGPWIAHCYTTPGTYTVELTVLEPSSGKIATTSTTVVVEDPDVVYAGTKTVCINPPGDSDFTGAPAGSFNQALSGTNVVVNDEWWWTQLQDGTERRYLFKAGATYPGEIGFDYSAASRASPGPHPMYSTYGGGKVDLLAPSGGENQGRLFTITGDYDGILNPRINDFRIQNIRVDGGFNSHTEVPDDTSASGKPSSLVRTNKYLDIVVQGCECINLRNSAFAFYFDGSVPETLAQDNTTLPAHAHVDDCSADNYGGQYSGLYTGDNDRLPDSSLAVTGCRFVQRSDAISGGAQHRAWFRENGHHRLYMTCCDGYGKESQNSGWKILTTVTKEIGHIANIYGIASEGNYVPMHIGQNIAVKGIARSVAANVVLDGLVLVGDYTTNHLFNSYITGVTVRNVLGIIPDSPRLHNSSFTNSTASMNDEESTSPQVTYTSRKFLSAFRMQLASKSSMPSPETLGARCAVYNCTFLLKRALSDNGGNAPAMMQIAPEFTNVTAANNVLDGPWSDNSANATPFAPLQSDVLWGTRVTGWKGYVSQMEYTEFASPADSITSGRPLAGSPAFASATGPLTAHTDITGAVRPALPSVGAWDTSDA